MWVLWSKIYFIENSFWKFYDVRSEKGGFQLLKILGLLGIYFDAVVVEVFTFFQIGSGHTVRLKLIKYDLIEVFATLCDIKLPTVVLLKSHES